MNMRLIAMISSVAVLVSATSSPGTDSSTSPVTGNPGTNVTPVLSSQSTSETTPSSSTSSASFTTTSSPSTSDSTTPTLKSLSSVNMPNTSNNTHITISTNHSNQTNNTPSTSNVHILNIHSSIQQSNGSGEITTQVPSVTKAPVNVPVTTVQQTTAFHCNCSKFLTTSIVSVSKLTTPTPSPTTGSTTAAKNKSLPVNATTETPTATAQPITMAPQKTTEPPETTVQSGTTAQPETTAQQETTTLPETTTPPETTVQSGNTTPPETTTPTETTLQSGTNAKPITKALSNITAAPAPTAQPNTTPTPVTSAPLRASAQPKPHKKSRRDVMNIEVDNIQSEDISNLFDDSNTVDLFCINQCNITMNETTTETPLATTTERPTTTTPKPTTTTPRHRAIDLSGKLVDLNLIIVAKGNFTHNLTNQSSTVYTNLAKQFNSSLTEFYGRLISTKFRKIVILGFSNGSIKCNYTLEMDAPINESDSNSTLQILRDVNWKNASLTNLTLDVDKTATEQALHLSNDSVFLPANVCVNNEVLEWDNNGDSICKYKCDISEYKGKCGDHGECSFTYGGAFRCICKEGYSGNLCKPPKPTTTTAKPIKPDAIALSKIDIIGIAGGIGGGLVLILLVALCCVYTKLNKAKKRDRFYGYMDNDKEFLHDENSRIENVPDLKNEYTNLGYQTEQNELQMQRFEPEGKNVEYEPGQRQRAYERDDKAYRQVEEPEGGNVMIYQPKHLNGPMERQSGASKFDEVEERSNPYRMMDTDTTYKIRRPTVNSDRNVPYN